MPSSTEPPDIVEAEGLLEVLNKLVLSVGEAYVELSGHTAAMQTLVADMRHCGSYVHSRLVAEPVPAPWLAASSRGVSSSTSPAATPPARRASFGQEGNVPVASSAAVGAPLGFRSPPPAPPSPAAALGTSPSAVAVGNPAGAGVGLEGSGAGLGPAAPCTPATSGRAPSQHASTPSPAASKATTSRPPLAGGRAHSVGRAGPARRPPAAAPRNLANMPAAGRPSGLASGTRTRDASPQRRAGSGGAPAAAATPLRSASPLAAGMPQTRGVTPVTASKAQPGLGPAPGAAAQADAPGTPAVGSNISHGGGDGSSCSSSSGSSHLPLAAQRALAAAASLAGGTDGLGSHEHHHGQQPTDGPPKPPGPPQLPLALRRAMQRYRETLQTRDQLVRQYQQRRGGGHGSANLSLGDTVAAAGRSYRAALARQYPSTEREGTSQSSAGTGGGGAACGSAEGVSKAATQLSRMSLASPSAAAPGAAQSASELRRRAQVIFAALVAAQTWLIQSLSELARSRGTPGGAAAANRRMAQADTCAALLSDVELLRTELSELEERIRASAISEAPAAPPPPPAVAASMCGRVGSSPDALAGVAAALGIDGEELEEAAALWRNRFLRALLCDAVPGGGPAGSGARRGQGVVGAAPRSLPPSAASQHPPLQMHQLSHSVGDPSPVMRRPLGFWLPDAMWVHVPSPGNAASADAVVSAVSAARQSTVILQPAAMPWQVLLPQPNACGMPLELAGATRCATAAPAALACASAADAVAHGRAQLQLQATVFQQLLEGTLAAPLLPRQAPPRAPGPLPHAGARSGWAHQPAHHHHRHQVAALAWERWLAQCRLAHLLLFKGAWNRLCSVVQLEEEDPGEESDQ